MRYPVLAAMTMAALAAAALPAAAEEAPSARTQDIYVSTGEHGEVSFSDVAQPGAERVQLAVATLPTQDAQEELQRRIDRDLAVADSLERSRLAREKARADARAAAAAARAQAAPEVVYQDRYVESPYLPSGFYGFAGQRTRGLPGHLMPPHVDPRDGMGTRRDGRHRRAGQRTLVKQFLYDRPD